MKPYEIFTAAGKEYKAKITALSAVEFEEKLNCGIIDALNRIGQLRYLADFYFAALKPLNPEIKTKNDVLALIDDYMSGGGTLEELQDTLMEILHTSGLINQEAIDVTKKFKEKQKESLKESLK